MFDQLIQANHAQQEITTRWWEPQTALPTPTPHDDFEALLVNEGQHSRHLLLGGRHHYHWRARIIDRVQDIDAPAHSLCTDQSSQAGEEVLREMRNILHVCPPDQKRSMTPAVSSWCGR